MREQKFSIIVILFISLVFISTIKFTSAIFLSFTYSPNPVAGNPITFSSSATTCCYSYYWNFGDGQTSTNGPTTTHTFSSPGDYTVYHNVVDNNNDNNRGATNQIVHVNPSGSTLTVYFTSSSNWVAGSSGTFTATVSGGTPSYTYSWNFGDGSTASGNPVNHVYPQPNSYTVKLLV